MEAIALTDEDRAILALESAAVAGHTCKVVLIGAGAPSADDLRGVDLAAAGGGARADPPALRAAGATGLDRRRGLRHRGARRAGARGPVRRRGDASRGRAPVRGAPGQIAAAVAHRRDPSLRRGGAGLAHPPRPCGRHDGHAPRRRRALGRRPRPQLRPARRGARRPRRPAPAPRRVRPARGGADVGALAVRRDDRIRSRGGLRPCPAAGAPRRGAAARRRERQRRRADRRGGRAARLDPAPSRPRRRACA